MENSRFKPRKCECCGQSTEYLLGIDQGSARILLKLLGAVARKGVNQVHPTQELEFHGKEKWMVTNFSRPRRHGLIAYVDHKNKPGYYCITRKAGRLLRGEAIPKYAIVSKTTGHQDGYWQPELRVVTLRDLITSPIMWSGKEVAMVEEIAGGQENTMSLFGTMAE